MRTLPFSRTARAYGEGGYCLIGHALPRTKLGWTVAKEHPGWLMLTTIDGSDEMPDPAEIRLPSLGTTAVVITDWLDLPRAYVVEFAACCARHGHRSLLWHWIRQRHELQLSASRAAA